MLKRLFNLTLTPKRYLPVVQSRCFTVDSKNEVPRNSDDIADVEHFKKISINDFLFKPSHAVSLLVKKFKCTKETAEDLVQKHEESLNLLTLSELTKQIQTYVDAGIDKDVLLKYPEVLLMNPAMVNLKLDVLRALPLGENGNGITDYVPLMKLPVPALMKLKKIFIKEQRCVPRGTRIHFMSQKFNVEPYIISALFSNYPFLIGLPLKHLFANTDLILEYKILPADVLRDPWILRYTPRRSRQRLIKAKAVRANSLRPWMVHCDTNRLNISLKITSDIKAVLKETNSKDVVDYLSKRLGFERTEISIYMARFPAALKVRVTKMKKILDFLLNDAGYTPIQVARVPRILCFGLKQMKERHEELESLGYSVSSLTVFCLTRQKYSTFVERVKKHRNYLKRDKKKSVVNEEDD